MHNQKYLSNFLCLYLDACCTRIFLYVCICARAVAGGACSRSREGALPAERTGQRNGHEGEARSHRSEGNAR